MNDRTTEKDLYSVLIELFRILEDRTIDAQEGAQLCRACVLILQKIRTRVPKLWQRITIDTSINILNELSEYLITLNKPQ
jgi:hypothetical protein